MSVNTYDPNAAAQPIDAELVGADPNTDVALIKIEGSNFPFAKFGNSEKLQIGEWVIAIGTPFSDQLKFFFI